MATDEELARPGQYKNYSEFLLHEMRFQRTRDLTLSEPEDGLVAPMETGELRASTATDIHESGSILISVTIKTENLRREWFRFRSRIESMDASVVRLESYRKIFWSEDINPNHALKDSVWDKTLRKWAQKLNEARSLEGQVRDYLQVHVGQLSLEESKKSIEVRGCSCQEQTGQIRYDSHYYHHI